MYSFVSSGGWEGQANFKMSFLSGGAIELGQHLFKLATNGLYAKFCYCVHCPLWCEVMTGSTIFHLKNNLSIQKDITSFQMVGISDLLGIWFIQARTCGFFLSLVGKNGTCVWVNTSSSTYLWKFHFIFVERPFFPPFLFQLLVQLLSKMVAPLTAILHPVWWTAMAHLHLPPPAMHIHPRVSRMDSTRVLPLLLGTWDAPTQLPLQVEHLQFDICLSDFSEAKYQDFICVQMVNLTIKKILNL